MKLFELFATLGLQTGEFEKGVQDATKQGSSFASALSGNFTAISAKAVALGNAMYDVGKAIAKSGAEAVKSIITEYADTEQLVGGVETIFKGSAQSVISNAENAFRTAGMSANEYMETVTSFSSSLLQGLDGDTAKAAEVADMAIRDMSDNANKFGTDMGLIQNAYQGFAKDNFTMLDNLKLGYGGTQAEMARLINDSGVLGDAIVDASTVAQVPLDKMFEAIHIVQTEMDIAGTTAKEASSTIAGSFNAFQAAWKNAISGMADDKDMGRLIDDLFETGENLVTNVLNLMPKIWDNVVEGVDSLLDRWDLFQQLKRAYSKSGWAEVWKEATNVVSDAFEKWGPMALDKGAEVLANVLTGLTGNATTAEEIKAFLSGLYATGTTEASNFVTAAKGVLGDIFTGLSGEEATAENVKKYFAGLFDAGKSEAGTFLDTAKGLLSGIYEAMKEEDSTGVEIGVLLGSVFSEGLDAVNAVKDAGIGLLGSIYTAITGQEATATNIGNTIGGVFTVGADAIENVLGRATTFFGDIADVIGDPDASLIEKVKGVWGASSEAIDGVMKDATTFFSGLYEALTKDSEGEEKVKKLFEGIFSIPRLTLDPVGSLTPTYQGDNARKDLFEQDYRTMAQTMRASPTEYGITESMANEWISVLMRDNVDHSDVMHEIIEAWNRADEARDKDESDEETTEDAFAALQAALEELPGTLASSLSGITVQLDGTTVGQLITPVVSSELARVSKSFIYSGFQR